MPISVRHFLEYALEYLSLLPHLAAFLLLALFSLQLALNLRFLRSVRKMAPTPFPRFPRVSVLVPARNEAASISSCVTSLLHQRYPDLEVIVLDDGSTDGTAQRLDALKARYPQLVVIHDTSDPPPGWNGKSYACHRLAERATGDWLLFTDADTIHSSQSVSQGINQATALDAALLSAFPHQLTGSWSERIMVSFIIDFIPLIALNFAAIWRGAGRRVAANGQYLLANASKYRAVGGHASVAHALIDDFALARRFQDCGYTVALVDGVDMLDCRMYRSFREVWEGFSKNLLGALASSGQKRVSLWWAPLFAWCYACLFVAPFYDLAFSDQRALAGLEILWLLLLRGLVVWRIKRPPDEILTTPLAAWSVIALGMGTLYQRWRKQDIVWKGRAYTGLPRLDS